MQRENLFLMSETINSVGLPNIQNANDFNALQVDKHAEYLKKGLTVVLTQYEKNFM
jgi:hypothetical protein